MKQLPLASTEVRFQKLDGVPAEVEQIDLTSVRRTPWRTLHPPSAVGVTAIAPLLMSTGLEAYAYSYESVISDLYVVGGLLAVA